MLLLDAEAVRRALPMAEAIAAMKNAFAAHSTGVTQAPPRLHLDVPGGVGLVMPAYVGGEHPALSVKVVSVFPGNVDRGQPNVQGGVLALDPETGRIQACLDGAAVTSIRTGAASGAATDLMAPPNASVVTVFGAGAQARTQAEAICAVRPIRELRIVSRTQARAEALAVDLQETAGIRIRAMDSATAALDGASIVCTATSSPDPVFEDDALHHDVHINAVGSFKPSMTEIPRATLARAAIVVDSLTAAQHDAGELIQAVQDGDLDWADVHGELGELVLRGFERDRTCTLFKSVGMAVQDAFAARVAVANAKAHGLGHEVPFG